MRLPSLLRQWQSSRKFLRPTHHLWQHRPQRPKPNQPVALNLPGLGVSEMDPQSFQLPLEQWLFILGIGLLVIEIIFLGFATFVLFFVGLAMLIVGALMSLGVLPVGVNIAIFAVSLLSIAGAVVLWKPLKAIQSPKEATNIEVGFVGHRFQVQTDISPDLPGTYTYSGIAWTVISDTAINRLTQVKVIKADVGQLTVTPVDNTLDRE